MNNQGRYESVLKTILSVPYKMIFKYIPEFIHSKAHAFCVVVAPSEEPLRLTITGTVINEDGTTSVHTETLIDDTSKVSENQYFQSKITDMGDLFFEIHGDAGSFEFTPGLCEYFDLEEQEKEIEPVYSFAEDGEEKE